MVNQSNPFLFCTTWLRNFVKLSFLSICALVLYVGQFESTNAYIGIVPLEPLNTPSYWVLLVLWLSVLAAVWPDEIRGPSDIFLSFYLLGTCLWSASYWPATNLIDVPQVVLLAVLLLLPAIFVRLGSKFISHSNVGWPVSWGWLPSSQIPFLVTFLLMVAALSYRVAGAEASFDYEEGFLRRLSGRDSFSEDMLTAYLMQMSMNGVAPFLAFIGAARRSKAAIIVAFGFAVFCFWLLASKAPFLNVLVLAVLGHLVRTGCIASFSVWIVRILMGALVFSIVEMWLFDLSLVADYGIRRVILVSSTIQTYFIDAMSRQALESTLLNGLNVIGYSSPEFFIGANYMNNELTNANSNAYLHEAAKNGAFGYVAVVVLTVAIILLFDLIYYRLKGSNMYALSAIMGILLIEQAFMTAIFSSGVGLCIFFSLIFMRSSLQDASRAALFSPGSSL